MTNLEGPWTLFVALSPLVVNLTAGVRLVAVRRWTRRADASGSQGSLGTGSVIAVLLFGYTLPGVLGGYLLWDRRTDRDATVTR